MEHRKNFFRLISFLLVIMTCLVILCGCNKNKRTVNETEDTTFGIDVARYQGTIDWQEVARSNVEFAMVRVGYRGMEDGIITPDSNGRYNLQEASRAGIKLGAYFFSTAVTEEEAREEALWVVGQINGYPITYPVVYDCENYQDPDSRQFGMTNSQRTDVALVFLKTIKDLGYEAMFYASKLDMEENRHWEMDRIQEDYKIWVAQYPAEPYPTTSESTYSGVHHMWQYSMDGRVSGIDGSVDMNIAYFGYDGTEEPKETLTLPDAEPDVEARMTFEQVNEAVTAKEETNLRNIPSQDADSQIMHTLKNGQVAHRIAISSSGWSKLIYEGEVYYAVSSYLTTALSSENDVASGTSADADDSNIKTQFTKVDLQVTAKEEVNLRSLPSVDHEDVEVIGKLKNGDVAVCVGVSDNGWSKLIYQGKTCFAVSSYLTTVESSLAAPQAEEDFDISFAERNELVTATDKVNLRSIPNTERKDSQIIGQLHNGDIATRIGISNNGWSKLRYKDTICYAVSRYLETVDTIMESEIQTEFDPINDRVTAKVEVNLRTLPSVEDPDCIVVAALKNGEVVNRTGINHDLGWSRVEYQGKTLYCISSYLKVA